MRGALRPGSALEGLRKKGAQMLRQTDAKLFKKYSQMKLQMKREALARLNRKANEPGSDTEPKS
jgi:uncharacterized protein YbjQ (UPF0145 family)